MQLPLVFDRGADASLQTQLFDQLRGLILRGRLSAGVRVPSTRDLARQTGLSRNTINLAYERLIAEGYLETREGVGTFVTRHLPEDALRRRESVLDVSANSPHAAPRRYTGPFTGLDPRVYSVAASHIRWDFNVGRPDPQSFPAEAWRRLYARRLASGRTAMMRYADPAGAIELRRAVARHLGLARGIDADPERIFIVAGVQEAINLTTRMLLGVNGRVAVELPSYSGAVAAFESYDAELIAVPVDDHGIRTDLLPEDSVHVAYVTPSHQFPLGVTMSLERRLRLLDWAARTGAYILEDDYDSDFRFTGSPLTALQGLDTGECVVYTSTFSKSVGPGLRLGYMVVPPHLVRPLRAAKALLNNGHPTLDQLVMADFIDSGEFQTHLRRNLRRYTARRDALVAALRRHFGDVHLSGAEGGMHLVWQVADDLPDVETLADLAAARGVAIATLSRGHARDFGRHPNRDRLAILGFAALDEDEIAAGVAEIAAAARV